MSASSPQNPNYQAELWERYNSNWVRHLGLVAQRGDEGVKRELELAGHSQLGTPLIAPLSLLYVSKPCASSMAEALSVSQAYTSKLLNRLEQAGFIDRVQDPSDGRSRWLQLTCSGTSLIEAGLGLLAEISRGHQGLLGDKTYRGLQKSLSDVGDLLVAEAGRKIAPPGLKSTISAVVLSAVSELIQGAIWRFNLSKGHECLTTTHWRVIHSLGMAGSTNSALAVTHELSTQAISRTVRELTEFNYIERCNDGNDGRITRLVYATRGLHLLADTAESIELLGQRITSAIGARRFTAFCESLATLYGEGEPQAMADTGKLISLAGNQIEQVKLELLQLVDQISGKNNVTRVVPAVFDGAARRQLQSIIKAALARKL
ncbi:MAG: DNA-binding MarR family transcriptional regulator [Bermanella sp.]|jgi:DNA-binding MarR family transcriptional regulator